MKNDPQTVLLRCSTSKGMFSTEAAVEISVSGGSVSLFADRSLLVERDGQTYLKVIYAGENGEPENKTILLPTECFQTGSRWLSVPEEALLAA